MGVYLNLLFIAVIVVVITDLSGFIDSLKHLIWKFTWGDKREFRDFDMRPIGCSFCTFHWIGLIYLLISGEFTLLTYMVVVLMSLFTPIFKDIMILAKDFSMKIIDVIYEFFGL